ncbi:hypothetical protein Acr_01g0006930 [Actinidia rufa]|uniref:Uncharacterized protein n=1 Tax=Actinidia rufa TaxID=165716 RepID=A0A7J0E312_9ERIC|nr:hypothetical protein Acr_01g0006930 [Actinidia rufa]
MATSSDVIEGGGDHERDTLPPIGKGKRGRSADIMASLEERLQRVELAMADDRDKVVDMDQRIDGLEGGHEEFHMEMRGILNSLADSCKAQMDALKDSLQAEIAAIKEEIKEVKGDWTLCKMAVTQGGETMREFPSHPLQGKAGLTRVGGMATNPSSHVSYATTTILQGIAQSEQSYRPSFETTRRNPAKRKPRWDRYDCSMQSKPSQGGQAARLQLQEEQRWIKAVNTEARPIYGVARDVRLHIGDWCGQVDFTVVPMDDYPIVLGMEFLDGVRAFPIPFAETMCIMSEGSACMVPLAREALLKSKTLSAMQLSKEEDKC